MQVKLEWHRTQVMFLDANMDPHLPLWFCIVKVFHMMYK